jgi:ABC-type glycerol-3-phosphate transport system permease component
LHLLASIAIPLARPGIVAVGVLVALFAWNDFAGALVLIQRPGAFTAPLALTTFSTFYATDEGLRFAGLAITLVPPLVAFLLLERSVVRGVAAGTVR